MNRKPIIGIMARPILRNDDTRYDGITDSLRRSIIFNGGIPITILAPQCINYYDTKGADIDDLTEEEKDDIRRVVDMCDGVVLPGGRRTYEYDYFIASYLIEKDVPTLGICMGMQTLANADNKTYYGDGNEKNPDNHKPSKEMYAHTVDIDESSRLYQIVGKKNLKVNSLHSYHIKKTTNFKISAYSDDGLIEGIEYPGRKFILGVQFHPEKIFKDDEFNNKIIESFVLAAKENN